MIVSINGKRVGANRVTVNDGMNYGRFDSDRLQVDAYQLVLGKAEFTEAIEPEFDRIRMEIRADDIACREASEFTPSGYAGLSEMFDYPEDLARIVLTYLDRELLTRVLPPDVPAGGYVINSTESAEVSPNSITLTGRTFRMIE
ncbi:MAG: hypothetical protein QGG42_11000 [Phycisphaerae bacterium]|jgi:hypothetical protein|nr:hypothetical protein [Phycisphaerae bacterium]